MTVKVLTQQGEDTGKKITLKKEVFASEINENAVYLTVVAQQVAKRQGTAKTKERGEIKGSRKKLRKQKGSGRARVGDIKNPLFKGGGTVFGPKQRDYTKKINKKTKQVAKVSVLSAKAKANEIFALDSLVFDAPKTKEYKNLLENLKISDKKSCLVLGEPNENVYLSARNIPFTNVVTVDEINIVDMIGCSNLIFTVDSLRLMEKKLLN